MRIADDVLLDWKSATAVLGGVSRSSLDRWTRSGELPVVRLGAGIVRWHRDDITAFIEARRFPRTGEKR